MPDSQIRAIVRGRVQGVYFRASTQAEARRLDLAGFARNLPDGSVEVVAEGPEERVDELVRYLHVGPSHARVDRVEVESTSGLSAPRPFSVR